MEPTPNKDNMTDPSDAIEKEKRCPDCGEPLISHPDYRSWCPACDWNVLPKEEEAEELPPYERLYRRLGDRMAADLFKKVAEQHNLTPNVSAARLISILLALSIHVATLLLVILALVLLYVGWPRLPMVLLALLALGIAWLIRPRLTPKPERYLTRADLPALFGLVDRISQQLSAPAVAGIVLTPEFNASYGVGGVPPQPFLKLGLPLLSLLDDQEKVALLSHEIAHGVNGDPTRGFLVGMALESLSWWAYILRPEAIFNSGDGSIQGLLFGLLLVPLMVTMLLLSKLSEAMLRLLLYLLFYDSQRAEYYADRLAADVAGSKAARSLIDTFHYSRLFQTLTHTFVTNNPAASVFDAFKTAADALPQGEIERLRRADQLTQSRLDVTHPPTNFRQEMLARRGEVPPSLTLSTEEADAVATELAAHEAQVHREILDAYEATLYY